MVKKTHKKKYSINNNGDWQYVNIFKTLSNKDNYINKIDIINTLEKSGIRQNDIRIKDLINNLNNISDIEKKDLEKFKKITFNSINLIDRSVTKNFVIPDFEIFEHKIKNIYDDVIKNTSGKNADYIPQLAKVDQDLFGVAFCSVDGQILTIGDFEKPFCIQSISKTVGYCTALKLNSEEKVHKHIGREPSGITFNAIALNKNQLPHNPMINAGAIMACSLIKPKLNLSDRFEYITNIWSDLCAGERISFDNAVYHSEKKTSNRNYALAHFMQEVQAFPDNTNMEETLDFYFQCCSLQINSVQMSKVASSFANGGICPLTYKKIFSANTIKNCLSMMYSCGMYDFSGEYAFTVGLPAKSGVSGAIMIVIPGIGGFAIFSPRLDSNYNSVRGVEFSKRLVDKFNFHNYCNTMDDAKIDPRNNHMATESNLTLNFIWAASQGDLTEVKKAISLGIDINKGDYDNRTALHLALAEGRDKVAKYLIERGADINLLDRWGKSPLDGAKTKKYLSYIK